MESKKFNIFAIFMIVVMCAVTIFVGVRKNDNNDNFQDDILTIYKKLDDIDEKVDNSQGKSAYQIAVDGGFDGTEGEWLLSLKGKNGTNAPAQISLMDIYNSYLDATNQTSDDMDYDEFLIYYYSVVDRYDTKTATQLSYSTTVDICYSYYSQTYFIQTNGSQFSVNESKSGLKGGVSAGAGVIYQMLDTDSNSKLDTAYIITNYHVAYLENYSNDPNYVVYANYTSDIFGGGITVKNYFLAEDYNNAPDGIKPLSEEEAISKHFLIGTNDQYYGIYLYGYQDADYKLNATFIGGSADNDIAVLKIERENISEELASIFFDSGYYNEVTFGDSMDLVGGEQVIAVGNPLISNTSSDMNISEYEQAYVDAMVLSSTTGVVSSISNITDFESIIDSTKYVKMRLVRVDAAINSGNSGGGLYDLYGKLVGIVNSKMASSTYDNVGYAIPVNVAVGIAEQVIKQCEGDNPSSTNTRIKRLETQGLGFDVENGLSKSKLITNSNGEKEWQVSYNILIKNIDETSVAYLGGLRNDDVITEISFDGNTYTAEQFFNTDYELRDLLLKVNLTTNKITFKVSRAGGEQTIDVLFATGNFITIC